MIGEKYEYQVLENGDEKWTLSVPSTVMNGAFQSIYHPDIGTVEITEDLHGLSIDQIMKKLNLKDTQKPKNNKRKSSRRKKKTTPQETEPQPSKRPKRKKRPNKAKK